MKVAGSNLGPGKTFFRLVSNFVCTVFFILLERDIKIWSCPILIGEKYEGAKDAQVWALEQAKQNV